MMLNMIPNIRMMAARLAALLVLAALFCAGVQAAMAAEETLNIGIGILQTFSCSEYGKDPTLSEKDFPDRGGVLMAQHKRTHFAPLVTLDGNGSVIPWLAESYEISGDYRTITFHLRKEVKFADGKPLNASVVMFNLDRILTYGWKEKFSWAAAVKDYESTEIVDENTIRVHFKKGGLDALKGLCAAPGFGFFISPWDVLPEWDIRGTLKEDRKYNGLGPYYVDENESIQKQKLVLVKRNSWYDELNFHKPTVDKIVFTVISDPQTRVAALEKGKIDYISRYWNPSWDSLPSLESNSKVSIVARQNTRMNLLVTAWWKEPFNGTDGLKLRKALNYVLDRNEIVEGAFNGYAVAATDSMYLSPLLPGVADCCHKGYDYNIEMARKLLAESGWKDTDADGVLDKNGKPLRLQFIVCSDDNSDCNWQKDSALIIQSQLKMIGIDVQIQSMESGSRQEAIKKGDFDLRFWWSYPRSTSVTQSLVSDFCTGNDTERAYLNENRTLDALIKNAESADSEETREDLICQACQILYNEAAVIPLVYPKEYALVSSRVKNFQFGAYDALDPFEECRIED
ncbi:MAG: ABC transporter substrate-binding protein [Methanothrix sp.]|nr:ABC transporter substrate-binding protein [Methanothrix sp.]